MPGTLDRPLWALPAEPLTPGGPRRWLLGAVAALLVLVPSALVPDLVLALSLSVTGLAGLAAAASLGVQARASGDVRLRWAVAGFGAVPPLALLRSVVADTSGGGGAAAGLALLQAAALPLAVLIGLRAARTGARALPSLTLSAVTLPVAVAAVVASPALRALELAVAVLATAAVLGWEHTTGSSTRHGHSWVSVGLVLTVLGSTGRALVEQRDDGAWWAAVAVTDLGIVVPALGLSLVTARRYRRQLRSWRVLQERVVQARASSPLLPGRSVSPEEDEGVPGDDELAEVLRAGVVGIALQPVVEPRTGHVLGAEALARFGGPMPPDRWFGAARRSGRGVDLELIALRSALAYQPTLPEDAFLAVNLSPVALADDAVLAELRRCDLDRLVIEVTEQEAVRDYPAARAQLDALRALGARTAVDDTGAGFSSLRHVLLLQPDVIKLDRTLVVGVDHDERQRNLVAALVDLAEEVGVMLLAEGVESAEQRQALVELRLPAAQGYHLGVPVLQDPLER